MADRPTLATLAQLVKKIGYTPTGDEATRATDCLVDASELIRDATNTTWLNAGGTDVEDVPSTVERICLAVAFRCFDNNKALVQRGIGDSSQTWDRKGREGGEAVYLTDDERRRCLASAGSSSFRSITMVSPYDEAGLTGLETSLFTV